jgi:hypothetical protein
MGLTWTSGSESQFMNIGTDFIKKRKAKIEQAFQDVTKEAADKMRQIIQAGGINKTQKGGPRVDTGLMLESVNFTFESGGEVVTGKFGWTETQEIYFLYQEGGTLNVSAMLALTDTSQWAANEIIARMKAALG